ncbi:hypothetical protein [Isoptericola sp. NPDC056134]|uniref:hypothetical protein n=1 Tax=Isoptericola sp. NPDC056134 TaxID=3345723 RepID=UPI0035EAD0D8
MGSDVTSIRVSKKLRDRIKAGAKTHGESLSAYLARALRELEQREFLDAVAARQYDDADLAEYRQWEQADLGPSGEATP